MGACGSKAAVRGEAVVAVSGRGGAACSCRPGGRRRRAAQRYRHCRRCWLSLPHPTPGPYLPSIQAAVSPGFAKEIKGGSVTPQSAPSSSNGETLSTKPAESLATDPVRAALLAATAARLLAASLLPDCTYARASCGLAPALPVPAALFALSLSVPPPSTTNAHQCPPLRRTQVMMFDCREFEVEQTRESAVKSLGLVDTPIDDPRFNAITK